MMSVKQISLSILLALFLNSLNAQIIKPVDLWNGTGKFILGSARSVYGSDLKWIGGDTSGIKKSYGYDYANPHTGPVIIEDITFKTVRLYFDEKDKLYWIELTAVYDLTDSISTITKSEADIKNIMLYLKENLNSQGEEKYNYMTTKYKALSYEWKKQNNIITFSVLEGKTPEHEFVNLTIWFSAPLNKE